jgi:hypothetical protein
MPISLTAAEFVRRMQEKQSQAELEKILRYFKTGKGEYAEDDVFMGIRMGEVFKLAKEFIEMPPAEIEELLDSPVHEVRAGGLSIMDKQARSKKTPESRRKQLYELYLRSTSQINNWDLVDLAAPHVVGGYLFDKPRDVLYKLARSENVWERRTAITATYYFIRQGDVDDTFRIGEMLLDDDHDLIHKAVGGWVREAGKRDPKRLLQFLEKHARTMPRVTLRYACEHLDADQRTYFMNLRKAGK